MTKSVQTAQKLEQAACFLHKLYTNPAPCARKAKAFLKNNNRL